MGGVASWLGDLGLGVVNSGFAMINIILMSMFLVGGGPRWTRALIERQPAHHAERLQRVLTGVGAAVGNYVMGAIAQALVAAVTTWIVLMVLDVPYAVGLAALTFVLDLIPLVGATIAGVLVGIVTVFTGFPTTTIIWVIWAVVYQQIENNLIQPQIQRRAVAVNRSSCWCRCSAAPRSRGPRGGARDPGRGVDPDRHPGVARDGRGRQADPARAPAELPDEAALVHVAETVADAAGEDPPAPAAT